ncbi:MAG: hemerythrin domain-containing protein [Myxococcota bacterium]|nr:hemerythrin domain-containing protein [Myxococcota bacterium]
MTVDKDNGIHLLLSHHGETRRRLRSLRVIVPRLIELDEDLRREAQEEARDFVRFIEVEHRLHERDEALSLFPRLKQLFENRPELTDPGLQQELDGAIEEHEDFDRLWSPLEHWLCLLLTPDAVVSLDRLQQAIDALEHFFLDHFAREEAKLIPVAQQLGSDELALMAQEMLKRHDNGIFERRLGCF